MRVSHYPDVTIVSHTLMIFAGWNFNLIAIVLWIYPKRIVIQDYTLALFMPHPSVIGNLTVTKRIENSREQLCLIVEDKLGVDAVHIPLEDTEVDSLSYHPFLYEAEVYFNHNNVTYQKLVRLFVKKNI